MTPTEPSPGPQPDHPPAEAFFESYRALLEKLDERFERQGILDPATWIAVDREIVECRELTASQVIELHARIENRLRRASGGWG